MSHHFPSLLLKTAVHGLDIDLIKSINLLLYPEGYKLEGIELLTFSLSI